MFLKIKLYKYRKFKYFYTIIILPLHFNSNIYDHSVLNYFHSNKNTFYRKLLVLHENSRYSINIYFLMIITRKYWSCFTINSLKYHLDSISYQKIYFENLSIYYSKKL